MGFPKTLTTPIPEHLQQFIVTQDASAYTAIDQASWRFIMRISRNFFKSHAHKKYLDGLKETGISTDRIPLISEMDDCLKEFGWRAVGVSGFIPPSAFMEFQSLGILPIACDMRTLNHLAYTPAPDIVHEAAGHAPIIADPDYSNYLRNYGEVARKAIFSSQDMAVYERIRELSDLKENPHSTPKEIDLCQKKLDDTVASVVYTSEASYLARMNWWTVEYGLVGRLEDPKIYGAGLLSSVGESYKCLSLDVLKVPLSLDCINVPYDITKPQPQLFVTPHFEYLNEVLEEMASTMAFRKGGMEGLAKAKMARTVTTAEYDSGLQVSGTLVRILTDQYSQPAYLQYEGPTQLSIGDREIDGHSAHYHKEGFGSPIGLIRGTHKTAADLTTEDLRSRGFVSGQKGTLQFESGVEVCGEWIESAQSSSSQVPLLSFKNCTVQRGEEFLFRPEWGTYDMACGGRIVSVFGGAADRGAYLKVTAQPQNNPPQQKSNFTEESRPLVELYEKVRALRDSAEPQNEELKKVCEQLEKNHPQDWLLRMEILELENRFSLNSTIKSQLENRLDEAAKQSEEVASLIQRGRKLLS